MNSLGARILRAELMGEEVSGNYTDHWPGKILYCNTIQLYCQVSIQLHCLFYCNLIYLCAGLGQTAEGSAGAGTKGQGCSSKVTGSQGHGHQGQGQGGGECGGADAHRARRDGAATSRAGVWWRGRRAEKEAKEEERKPVLFTRRPLGHVDFVSGFQIFQRSMPQNHLLRSPAAAWRQDESVSATFVFSVWLQQQKAVKCYVFTTLQHWGGGGEYTFFAVFFFFPSHASVIKDDYLSSVQTKCASPCYSFHGWLGIQNWASLFPKQNKISYLPCHLLTVLFWLLVYLSFFFF